MEDFKIYFNFILNIILTGAFTVFLILIFGRPESKLNNMNKCLSLIVKLSLALCTVGSFLNVLTMSNPPWIQVIMNAGLASLFTWASYFHYTNFVKEKPVIICNTDMNKTKMQRKPRAKKVTK